MTLDWAAIGAGPIPSIEQVHWTRLWLEDTSLAEARLQLEELRLARAWTPPECPRREGAYRFPSVS